MRTYQIGRQYNGASVTIHEDGEYITTLYFPSTQSAYNFIDSQKSVISK